MEGSTATPPTPESLSAYVRARFHDFSRSQKDVAQYVVDHLDEAAFLGIEELARRANTSGSTVVRFAQALGFEGYPELQRAVREEYRCRHDRPIPAVGELGDEPSGAHDPPTSQQGSTSFARLFSLDQNEFEMMLAADRVNVEQTALKVSCSDVDAAVAAIATTPRLLVVGTDQTAFFASYLRHLLALLDLDAETIANPRSREALRRLSRIDDETLVMGLSAGRPAPLVVRAMKLACHRKARTIAITDSTLSVVAELAQIRLYYSSDSPAYVRSHTALLSLIQALAYGVYARDADGYADRLKAFRLN